MASRKRRRRDSNTPAGYRTGCAPRGARGPPQSSASRQTTSTSPQRVAQNLFAFFESSLSAAQNAKIILRGDGARVVRPEFLEKRLVGSKNVTVGVFKTRQVLKRLPNGQIQRRGDLRLARQLGFNAIRGLVEHIHQQSNIPPLGVGRVDRRQHGFEKLADAIRGGGLGLGGLSRFLLSRLGDVGLAVEHKRRDGERHADQQNHAQRGGCELVSAQRSADRVPRAGPFGLDRFTGQVAMHVHRQFAGGLIAALRLLFEAL